MVSSASGRYAACLHQRRRRGSAADAGADAAAEYRSISVPVGASHSSVRRHRPACLADRDRYIADPDDGRAGFRRALLNTSYLDQRNSLLQRDRSIGKAAAGQPWRFTDSERHSPIRNRSAPPPRI